MSNRFRSQGQILAIALGVLLGTAGSADAFLNAFFDDELLDWESQGDVVESSGFALVGDGIAPPGTLFQSVASGLGSRTLRFEFANALNGPVVPGSFSDFGFATLYFGNVPFVSPSDSGSYDSFIALFDIDANGAYNLNSSATIEVIDSRPGWSAFSVDFESTHSYLTPYFQVLEQNGQSADSALALDDFTVVPEQAFGPLALLILCWTLLRREGPRIRDRS